MNVREINRVYFVGIGGIGMSALARFFRERGAVVKGYDRTQTELTLQLEQEEMDIHYTDDVALLDQEAELVVYTPAIPAAHAELNWYRDNGYPVYKRSDVLQWITQAMHAVTVAGTHGKTTISTMIAYLLRETGYGCNAFLGGVSVNYNKNYWSSDNETAVVEADEYDRSFLKLHPDVAVLTAMDADHLDIYGTVADMEEAFIQYTRNIKPGGTLLARHGLHRAADLEGANRLTYSLQNDAADVYASNIVQRKGGYIFNVSGEGWELEEVHLPIGGMHNVENAVAAIGVTRLLNIDGEKVKEALSGFKGIRRRFEYVLKSDRIVFIDDYAHHPEELAALLKSAKQLFADRRCVVVFQPHLFTRTRDLAEGFAQSLDMADEAILLDIYPARELPIEGVTSQMIVERMQQKATILSKEGLLEYVKAAPLDLFITAGAGDIDKMVLLIKELLEKK
ncbi:MAG: UDP-N-acetylmuramate--L-alanine ligase [Flavipsychrobacter sp.]|nr:UDP-N-acetylmuramate--L-alanine ligase [Flavipsychrobacter sp.]